MRHTRHSTHTHSKRDCRARVTLTLTLSRYASQRARKPPPKCGVLSDEGPANSIADHCRRKDAAPLPPSSAAAALRRALTQRCQTYP